MNSRATSFHAVKRRVVQPSNDHSKMWTPYPFPIYENQTMKQACAKINDSPHNQTPSKSPVTLPS
jgi:hypothetical protein